MKFTDAKVNTDNVEPTLTKGGREAMDAEPKNNAKAFYFCMGTQNGGDTVPRRISAMSRLA